MKVALAHLIPAPFTQEVGRALHDEGMLKAFFCTLVDEPDARWQELGKRLGTWVGVDLGRDLRRRAVTSFPMELVQTYPMREVLRMLALRLVGGQVLGDHLFHWALAGFDRWVAARLQGCDAVYSYEYGCLEMFTAAKRGGLKTIYDLPSPEHDYVERLLGPEYDRFPELKTAYRDRVVKLQVERTERRRQEWELSDLVIANSTFTAESWKAAGWSEKKVAVIPYGAPPVTEGRAYTASEGPLRAVWAGTFSVRKGAHYLLEAVHTMKLSAQHLVIDVYGAVTLPVEMMAKAADNFVFHGSVPRPVLFEAMQRSDLLVFPTLCDGFGLVVNEAFAQSLPVLTTHRAGAADLVQEGRNGWIVAPADTTALIAGLQRCLDSKGDLPVMREAARATAQQWQWADYRREVTKAVAGLGPA